MPNSLTRFVTKKKKKALALTIFLRSTCAGFPLPSLKTVHSHCICHILHRYTLCNNQYNKASKHAISTPATQVSQENSSLSHFKSLQCKLIASWLPHCWFESQFSQTKLSAGCQKDCFLCIFSHSSSFHPLCPLERLLLLTLEFGSTWIL